MSTFVNWWIFQCSEKYYNVDRSLKDSALDNFRVDSIMWNSETKPKPEPKLKPGDIAVIWVAGNNGGIKALGKIMSNKRKSDPTDAEYFTNKPSKFADGKELKDITTRVKIRIDRILSDAEADKVTRERLIQNPETCNLSILKNPRRTNYGVTTSEITALEHLLPEDINIIDTATVEATVSEIAHLLTFPNNDPNYVISKIDELIHMDITETHVMDLNMSTLCKNLRKHPNKDVQGEGMKLLNKLKEINYTQLTRTPTPVKDDKKKTYKLSNSQNYL